LTRLKALLGGLMPGGASSAAGGSGAGSGAASLGRTDSGRDKGSGSSPVALTRGNSGRQGAIPAPISFAGIFGRAASGRSDAPSASDGEYASLIANLAQPAGAGEAGSTALKAGTTAAAAGQQYTRRGTSGLGGGVAGTGDGDGKDGDGAAGGHTESYRALHTLKGVATAAVAVSRVADGPRRRRASAVQDPALVAEKLGSGTVM
jgi:hypothetical protein